MSPIRFWSLPILSKSTNFGLLSPTTTTTSFDLGKARQHTVEYGWRQRAPWIVKWAGGGLVVGLMFALLVPPKHSDETVKALVVCGVGFAVFGLLAGFRWDDHVYAVMRSKAQADRKTEGRLHVVREEEWEAFRGSLSSVPARAGDHSVTAELEWQEHTWKTCPGCSASLPSVASECPVCHLVLGVPED